ncbi:MAG TPA: hypothetical protein VL087_10875 [Nitrospirota bacterium]|nr:hypothetical protein [Nitrospirota bacterium]
MARYIIESPHTKEECLRALDEELGKGRDILGKFDFGCKAGDHTAYAIVDVNSRNDALDLVPTFLRNKARIVEVGKITPEMIKSFHTKAA